MQTTLTTQLIGRFLRDDRGVTAIEYCIMAAAMGLALVPASNVLQAAVMAKFSTIQGYFK